MEEIATGFFRAMRWKAWMVRLDSVLVVLYANRLGHALVACRRLLSTAVSQSTFIPIVDVTARVSVVYFGGFASRSLNGRRAWKNRRPWRVRSCLSRSGRWRCERLPEKEMH